MKHFKVDAIEVDIKYGKEMLLPPFCIQEKLSSKRLDYIHNNPENGKWSSIRFMIKEMYMRFSKSLYGHLE